MDYIVFIENIYDREYTTHQKIYISMNIKENKGISYNIA